MSKLTDSYCTTAAFHPITSWMTSLWGIEQMPIARQPSSSSTPPCSLFSLCRQENYCHFIEQSPEALRCSLPLMRAPLGTIGGRFMKPPGRLNGLSVPPPFASNHDNKSMESGMAVHWHHRGAFPSPTAGCVGGVCMCVCVCVCVGGRVRELRWKIIWFNWIYSFSNCCKHNNDKKYKLIKLRVAATSNYTKTATVAAENLTVQRCRVTVNNQDKHHQKWANTKTE